MLKKTFRNGMLAVLTIVLSQLIANAQTTNPLSNLLKLEGHWEASATFKAGGKTYMFPYHADFKKSEDGSGIYMKEWFNSPELGKYVGSNLVGYNANDSKVHWFTTDNFGTSHDHIGMWKSPTHFFMQATEMRQNKKYIEKIDLTFTDNNTLGLLVVGTVDGKETERITGTFKRTEKCSGE